MKVTILKAYKGNFGNYPLGHICEVSREIGKYLIREGYAAENQGGATNQDRFVIENRPPEEPQVVIVPYPAPEPEKKKNKKRRRKSAEEEE